MRALAPFIAGTSRMPLRRFLPYDVLGAGAWSATFATLGYVFWHSFDQLTTYVSRGLFAFGTVVAVIAALVWLVQLRRDPAKRERVRAWLDEHRDQRGWRPIVRLAGPVWRVVGRPTASGAEIAARFGRGRVTPGAARARADDAARAAGRRRLHVLHRRRGRVAARDPAQSTVRPAIIAERLATDPLVEIAKVVTELGSLPVVAALTLATAVWALTHRRWIDAAALVVGLALVVLLVHVAKAAYDRDRPTGGLGRRRPRRLSVRPHGVRGRARRLRHGAGARRQRLGGALRARDGGRRARSRWSA